MHCNIAFGELVVNFPESQIKDTIDTLMLALIDILKEVPLTDFDECLSWQGMPVAHPSSALKALTYLII